MVKNPFFRTKTTIFQNTTIIYNKDILIEKIYAC